jgi:hypothetical protein
MMSSYFNNRSAKSNEKQAILDNLIWGDFISLSRSYLSDNLYKSRSAHSLQSGNIDCIYDVISNKNYMLSYQHWNNLLLTKDDIISCIPNDTENNVSQLSYARHVFMVTKSKVTRRLKFKAKLYGVTVISSEDLIKYLQMNIKNKNVHKFATFCKALS